MILAHVFALLAALSGLDPAAAAAHYATQMQSSGARFEGTFESATLALELRAQGDGYAGVLRHGQAQYPVTARLRGQRLEGTFDSQGSTFAFTATLGIDGAALTFTTDGTTYTLRRLSQPPPHASPAASARSVLFRLVRIQDRDDMIGGEACSFLAPAGWKVEGGIAWRLHPAMPAGLACRIYDPGGLTSVECFPALPYSWGSHLASTGFPIGSTYLGNEVQPPPRDAVEYLTRLFLPRHRAGLGATLVEKEPLADFARAVKEAEYPDVGGVRIDVSAARVRLEYRVAGQPVQEDVYAAVAITRLGPANSVWIADHLCGFRAERGRLDEQAPVFLTIVKTGRVNLRWYNAYAELVKALSRAQVDHLRKIGEIGRQIAANATAIREENQRDWEARQARMDRLNQSYSRYQRGVELFDDPVAGRLVELPANYGHAWRNDRGEYLVTESGLYNPNETHDGTWTRLEPLR